MAPRLCRIVHVTALHCGSFIMCMLHLLTACQHASAPRYACSHNPSGLLEEQAGAGMDGVHGWQLPVHTPICDGFKPTAVSLESGLT